MVKKIILSSLFAVLGALAGAISCFALTPVWWKIESNITIELAGHSGPTDWLLVTFSLVFGISSFLVSFHRV